MPTNDEPHPIPGAQGVRAALPDWPIVTDWATSFETPTRDFMAVLATRRSSTGAAVGDDELAALLRHSTMLRHRGSDGRFGRWESRPTPSAGGMHAIRILCLPWQPTGTGGIYDADRHVLFDPPSLGEALRLNRSNVGELTAATDGTTLQLVADIGHYDSCYRNSSSLMWRDSGALCATIGLVAAALSLTAVVLGRIGTDIVEAAGLMHPHVGAGAIHIGVRDG